MAITVSPYLSALPTVAQVQPAPTGTGAPQNPGAASSADSVNLSPAAEQALAGAPPDPNKTKLQSTLEAILTSVQTSTGPTLTFRPAPDSQTGKTLDQSC